MPFMKTYVMMLIAIPAFLIGGLVTISAGVNYLHDNGGLPPMILAISAPSTDRTEPLQTSTAPAEHQPEIRHQAAPQPQPVQIQQNDNTAAWITLISTLALAAFAAITSMFNTYMQVKLKIAVNNTQASLDENTVVTKATRTAVSKQTEVVGQIKKDIDESNH